jgi:uncharacterized protein (TIGR00255 family)
VLLSMTGFGEARHQDDRQSITVEVRTVNNRHLKLSARIADPFVALEPELDRLVREHVRRGSVLLNVRVDRPKRPEDYRLNLVALRSYREQLEQIRGPGSPPPDPADLLVLPGVVEDRRASAAEEDPHEDWPTLEKLAREALARLQESRAVEGRAMADELLALGRSIAEHLERVAERAPVIVESYAQRLLERVQALVQDRVTVEPRDLIREVAIFAERGDIAEEITRLRAHLDQFVAVLGEPESVGRKLEFVVQEMGRETNTIGSKANDVEISRAVVEMKGSLEKIRELIQNVE